MDSIPVVAGLRCANCGRLAVPPQYVCAGCGATRLDPADIAGRGTLYTYTVIRVAPQKFQAEAPYCVIVVDLAPGVRVTGRLIKDSGPVEIGQEMVLDRIDERGYWFRRAQ